MVAFLHPDPQASMSGGAGSPMMSSASLDIYMMHGRPGWQFAPESIAHPADDILDIRAQEVLVDLSSEHLCD